MLAVDGFRMGLEAAPLSPLSPLPEEHRSLSEGSGGSMSGGG